jgi:transcriptional regulator with XRE-family HTH domain
MTSIIDHHVGKRLRRRRRLLGLTQQQLADRVGVRFQQIQKYECGANRVSAARLFQLSESLNVPVGYFYEGLNEDGSSDANSPPSDMLSRRETLELVRVYYQLDEQPRRRLLDLAKAMQGGSADAA